MDDSSISKEERQKFLGIISEIKDCARELAECARPLFDGNRFLSDAELARRLRISRSTLSNYRIKGIFGYYSLGGKIIYADREIENISKTTITRHIDDGYINVDPDNPRCDYRDFLIISLIF